MTKKDEFITKSVLDETIKAQTDEIVGVIHTFMDRVDDRFAAHNVKFGVRFDKIEEKLDSLQSDMTSVVNRLDSIEKDISLTDDERQIMGMQLNRIHDWIEKTAKKVGVEFVH